MTGVRNTNSATSLHLRLKGGQWLEVMLERECGTDCEDHCREVGPYFKAGREWLESLSVGQWCD